MKEKFDFLEADPRSNHCAVNKVYFTSHEDDYEAYYKRIVNDVVDYSEGNCIIYRNYEKTKGYEISCRYMKSLLQEVLLHR